MGEVAFRFMDTENQYDIGEKASVVRACKHSNREKIMEDEWIYIKNYSTAKVPDNMNSFFFIVNINMKQVNKIFPNFSKVIMDNVLREV